MFCKGFYYEDALLKYSVQDYEGVKKELITSMEEPTRYETYYLLGLTEFRLGNYKKAIKYFSGYINYNSLSFESGYCFLHRGNCNLILNNYNFAKNDFFNALNLLPRGDMSIYIVHYLLAITETELGNYNMAITDFSIVINNLKHFPEPYIWRAYCNIMLGNKNKAREDVKSAMLLGKDDLEVLYFQYLYK